MGKKYDKCKLCQSNKLLNFADLCKRCNRDKASIKIKEEALKKRHAAFLMKEETAKKAAEQATEPTARRSLRFGLSTRLAIDLRGRQQVGTIGRHQRDRQQE